MASGYWSPVAIGVADGPTQTTVTAASVLPVTAKFTFPPNSLAVGSAIRVMSQGRISCAVTTPGTMRLDIRLGGTVMYDSGALNLNVVAKTTVPWWFDAVLTVRAVGSGTNANAFGFGRVMSEALVGAVTTAVGSNTMLNSPVGTPAVGSGFDSTISNTFDMFFTQTVTTGSFTVHNFFLETGAIALT